MSVARGTMPHVRPSRGGVSCRETWPAARVHARRWESHCWPNRRRGRLGAVAPTDDDLIALVLAGRGDAFGTLVERYERAVYHLAFRTLREVEEAKDAVPGSMAQSLPRAGLVSAGREIRDLDFHDLLPRLLRSSRQAQALHRR